MKTSEEARAAPLEPKTKLSGVVVKTTLAGALVDLGRDIPGVVHISQLQAGPVNKVEDLLQPGQTVNVWVRRVRHDRIELTMIEPVALDWKDIQPEQIVKGKVVRLEAYGAFVEFGAERPGLIHVSELSRTYVKDPSQVVKEGDEVEAKVLSVDRQKRQIRLSLKALQPEVVQEKQPREQRRPRIHRAARKAEPEPAPHEAEVPAEAEVTAMQMAWQQALDKSKEHHKARPGKSGKRMSKEQEDILRRTLDSRVPTSS